MRRPTSTLDTNRRRFIAPAVAIVLAVAGLTVLAIFVAASTAPGPAPVTPTAAGTQAATPTPAPTAPGAFPTRESAGLPDGWKPVREVTGEFWIREAGTVIEDVRFTNGTIYVDAPNVTLRRIEAVGTKVVNDYRTCQNGLVIEDSNFVPNGPTTDQDLQVIGAGGYTVRNIMIDGVPEGLRVSGQYAGCGPTVVEDSFIRVTPPDSCGDWHGDGIQGYQGTHLVVRNTTVIMVEEQGCGGTAPFFYPHSQGNTSVDIDGLLVSGGGYSFRNGMPGPIKNLNIVDGSWGYGPVDVNCAAVQSWQADAVTLDAAGQPVAVGSIDCSGEGN